MRFLSVLPTFVEALEHARGADAHPGRWRVQPLASPSANAHLWKRLGPMVTDRFGPGFGQTWLKVWAAFAAVQAQRRFEDLTARLRKRLDDPKMPAEKRQQIRGQIERIEASPAPELQAAGTPPENVQLVRTYADELAELSDRLFRSSRER